MKKIIAELLLLSMTFSLVACGSTKETNSEPITQTSETSEVPDTDGYQCEKYATITADEIVSKLTLDQKAAQMVQPAVYMLDEAQMQEYCYGSILSKNATVDAASWCELTDGFQQAAISSEAGIPYLYGNDDVHGVNYCDGAVLFPHNIGIGAANDTELTYKMGLAVGDEAKMCHMLWNFSPCVAQSEDPRWGRTYESYGADLDIITSLSTSYTKGLIDSGIIACAKHFFGDGNVEYGTGEKSDSNRIIDRGDAKLTDEEINKLLSVYQAQIDAGVQTIMVSHSSVNGVKMHENAKYLQYLKNEMGFKGFIVSDWNSVQNISVVGYDEQVITAVNDGIDMLMEVDQYEIAREIIVDAVKNGKIPEERINDAVARIIQVKLDAKVFEDPFCKNMKTNQTEPGSNEYRNLAKQLVEKSLVLLKNEGNVLPFTSGKKIYVTGPAIDHAQAQCGGWTVDWNSSPTIDINGVTTILDAFEKMADEYGITIITDKSQAQSADAVLLVVGENAYAEWNGDTEDMELCGNLGLGGNKEAIDEAKELNIPTVTCIIAGRQVIIDDYFDDWDAVVMCYLPGSEGTGIVNVLCGKSDFSGKLPSPWYRSIDQIGTTDYWLEKGYGLSYSK